MTRRNNNLKNTDRTQQLIKEIKYKLDKSPALNGEFETLIHKVDKIEESSGNLSKKVDKIYDSIYHHEDGLYVKMKENKMEKSQEISSLDEWKKNREKFEEKASLQFDKLENVQDKVESIVEMNKNIWVAFRWTIAALGGAFFTIITRYIVHLLT